MSNSFRNADHDRPQSYQTPSPPPMSYIEPVSPSLSKVPASVDGPVKKTRKRKNAEQTEVKVRKRRAPAKSKAQKADKKQDESAMDAFATIALSMGPETDYRPTSAHYAPPQPSTTNFPNGYNHVEHDSKRVKHERSTSLHHWPAVSWHTSPSVPTPAQRSDAELLLNFSRGASSIYRPKTSTAVYHHHSPNQNSQPFVPPQNPHFYPTSTHSHGQNYTPHNGGHYGPANFPEQRLENPVGMNNFEGASYPQDNKHFANSAPPGIAPQPNHYTQQYHQSIPIPPQSQPHHIPPQNNAKEHGNTEAADGFPAHTSEPVNVGEVQPVLTNGVTSDGSLNKATTKLPKSEPLTICGFCHLTDQGGETTSWISCDACREWYHTSCAGFSSDREVRSVDKYRCDKCKPIHGPTTFVRKSTRAHTSIDYAGLNDGVLKTSDEDPEHHYIRPIKEGQIQFTPNNFARMRPEEVTVDYFRNGDGMSQPFLIPAAWNPRPGVLRRETQDEMKMDPGAEPAVNDMASIDRPNLVAEQPDGLGMIIPSDLTVKQVADLYGPDEKIEVIDVKTQNGEDRRWTLKRWVDYYESKGAKKVRNVISLEVSQSALAQLLERPKVVRDLDLQDAVWPKDLLARGEYPHVQYYCLMSVADCYTDFHIDFGGSSVFYHVIRGKKTFFFIPPTEKHLKKYEEWCNSASQNYTFLGNDCNECYRLDLTAGDTAFIPAGWIHAVWTPEDSLVIGGNFLSPLHYGMQIRVNNIEKATGVARKFRYPYFQKLMWYVALDYMREDPTPAHVESLLLENKPLQNGTTEPSDTVQDAAQEVPEHKPREYAKHELAGLPELLKYLHRTVLISTGAISDGVSDDTKSAVGRSIPKGHGNPTDLIRKFAIWCSWKRNEPLPEWVLTSHAAKLASTDVKVNGRGAKRAAKSKTAKLAEASPASSSRPSTAKDEMIKQEPVLENQDVNSISATAQLDEVNTLKSAALAEDSLVNGTLHMDVDSTGPVTQPNQADGAPMPSVESPQLNHDDMPFKDETLLDAVNDLLVAREEAESMNHELEPVSLLPDPQPEIQAPSIPEPLYSLTSSTIPSSKLKAHGRSKACKDCRRSKRRCVHDENGQTDPAKVAEAIQPRAGARKKNLDSLGIARVDSGSSNDATPPTGSELQSQSHKSSIDSTAETNAVLPGPFPNPKPLSPPESTLAGFSPSLTDDKGTKSAAEQPKPIFTPEPDESPRGSDSSAGVATTTKTNENENEAVTSSPTSQQKVAVARRGSKARTSEIEADDESLKLIRELQAQDMGLRVRA